MEEDIFNYEEQELLKELLKRSGRCSRERRESLIRDIGLDPSNYDLSGETGDFIINFVGRLIDVGDRTAIERILKKVGPNVPGFQQKLLQLEVRLGIAERNQPPPIRPPIPPPVSSRPAPSQNTTISVVQPTALRVRHFIAIVKKIWFIILPIAFIWLIVGKQSKQDIPSDQLLNALLFYGAIGGFSSGVGAELARWRVARSIQWEQALMHLIIGLVGGSIGWTIVAKIADSSIAGILRSYGEVFGLFVGLIVVTVILWWLSLIRSRS